MKLLKTFSGLVIFSFFLWASSTQFSGCVKKDYIHDTTTVHDTAYDIKDGLVAWYTFNAGSLNDGSGFNNNIVNNGATAATDRFGNANNAYSFNGTSSYMRIANNRSINPTSGISLMAIFKINGFWSSAFHGNQLIGKGYPDNANGFYILRYSDINNNPCCSPPDLNHEVVSGDFGDNNPLSTAPGIGADTVYLQTGKWYNVIYTYDGLQSKIYINGVLKNTQTKSGAFTPNSNDLFIGKYEDPAYPYYFNGIIDEVRIYNRALPQGAVTSLNKLTQ